MAKNLSKSGISTTQTIEAWHVTQSIDAFTGADAYNINLSGSLEVTGSSKLSGSVTLNDITYPTSDGTQFTVLRTDGAGNTIFDYADRVYLEVRSDEALTKGDPIYITGFNNGQNRIAVAKADAADSNKMPAIGLVWETVGINANTQVATVGSLDDVNTQTAPNDFQEGDVLYVKAGGGLTNVKPTGSALIQNVGKVGRRNTNNGQIVVFSIGRSNDIPNISPGYFWVGNSDSVATAVPTSSISVTPPTLQQVTDQGSSTTTAITASIISASNTVFISASLLDPSAHVLTVDTSSGQVFYTPFEISSSGGGNVIGSPLKPLKLDGSTATVQSTGVIDAKATQTNFKNTSGTTLASIDHTTGDAHFGLSSVDIKGNGEISSSKQLITSDGPNVEDLLMILSPPSANFDDTGSAAVNVNLSGSISASNAYALKLTSPDNNTFGIKADGEVIPSKVTMSDLTLSGSGGFGYIKFGTNQDQVITGYDNNIIIDGDGNIRLQADSISIDSTTIGNSVANAGGSTIAWTGSINLKNGSTFSGSITTEGYISASAFAGDGSSLTGIVSASYAVTASHALNVPGGNTQVDTYMYSWQAGTDSTFFNDGNISITYDESNDDIDLEFLTEPSSNGDLVCCTRVFTDGVTPSVDWIDITTQGATYELAGSIPISSQVELYIYHVDHPIDTSYPRYKVTVAQDSDSGLYNNNAIVKVYTIK